MFLMTRTYLFESFDIFLIASNLIKSEELAWPLWPVYFRDILNHPFSRHVPKKLLPTTGDDCSEMCHFDFKGHMCQCALQRCDNSPVLRMRSFMNLHLWWLEHARRWHSIHIYIYIIIYIHISNYIYIYYPKIVSWCACGHLTPILITIYMEWYESNLFKCSDILVQILVHIESQNCDKSHLSILPNSTHHDPRLPVAGHQAPP